MCQEGSKTNYQIDKDKIVYIMEECSSKTLDSSLSRVQPKVL